VSGRDLALRFQITDPRNSQQRQDVRHVILTDQNDRGLAQDDAISILHFILFPVSHFDNEKYPFVYRCLNWIFPHARFHGNGAPVALSWQGSMSP